MAVISLYNTGKRTWLAAQTRGLDKDLKPGESAEIDEADARRMVMDYPSDFSLVGRAIPSSADLERREQSIKDREANLKKKEEELAEREKALKAKEEEIANISLLSAVRPAEQVIGDAVKETGTPAKGKPGRKPNSAKAGE